MEKLPPKGSAFTAGVAARSDIAANEKPGKKKRTRIIVSIALFIFAGVFVIKSIVAGSFVDFVTALMISVTATLMLFFEPKPPTDAA